MGDVRTVAPQAGGGEAAPPTEGRAGRRWRGWRRGALVVALAGVAGVAAAIVWGTNLEPLRAGSGGYDVRGTAELVRVSAPLQRDWYVATFVDGDRVTLRFPLFNEGPLPVRILEVFPQDRVLGCGWKPDEVTMSPSLAEAYRPFEPTTLGRQENLDLAISGVLECDGHTDPIGGLSSYDRVPVRWRTAGVFERTSDIDPGYLFAWSDEPEEFLEDLVQPVPREAAP